MRKNIKDLALGAAIMLTLAGCSSDGGESAEGEDDGAAATATVSVEDNFFDPDRVDISVGDTVLWQWVGAEPHNVSADNFESAIQNEGTLEHTFDEAGSYPYVCTVHPGMEGTIEVTD